MKERPILFSGPMVRAILDGRKTQTRRPVKSLRHPYGHLLGPEGVAREFIAKTESIRCPLGQPCDRLWVRETWRPDYESDTNVAKVAYHAGGCTEYFEDERDEEFWVAVILGNQNNNWRPWRPSIHMPRWASRITLEITRVGVERVQDITEEDAWCEGRPGFRDGCLGDSYGWFRSLWQSIYGTWDDNPWVWVVEFKRVKP